MKTIRKKRIFGWLALALLASCQRASESDSQALLGLIQSSAADQGPPSAPKACSR